jgi:hypothetical protein
MPLGDLSELETGARRAVERYMREIESGLCRVDRETADDVIDSVRSHLLEQLEPTSSEYDVEALVAEMGSPDEYASALCEAMAETEDERQHRGAGSVLGVPYDVRIPTVERVAMRWWNPHDRRVFVPRVFGIGWDINFGALAVLLRFIEPDSEDEPFGNVSDTAFLATLLVPVGMCAAILGSYLATRHALPVELPVHWSWRGTPDRFQPAGWAFLLVFLIAATPTVWAVWSVATRRPPLNRGAVIGLASLLSSTALFVWVLTLASGLGAQTPGWVFPTGLVCALLVPLGVLTVLARAGRSAEQRRDLHGSE